MSDGMLFLGAASLICAAAFLVGLRFSRMTEEKLAGRQYQLEMPAFLARKRTPAEQFRLLGRMMMIVAPLFLLFFAALSFGLLGPFDPAAS
jgi:hypothetical protein